MIGIVGGGIAGLAAAYRLRQHGFEVQVFEAGDNLGGLAATYETRGDRIEKFYHHLSQSEDTIVELAQNLGLDDHIEWRYKSDAYYINGTVYPMDTIWEIAAYPYLSFYDKFRLGMLTFGVDVRNGVPSFDTYDNIEDFETVGVKEFVCEHATENAYKHFFRPLLNAKFGSRKDEVSAAWLLGRIKFRGERDLLRGEMLGYFEGGFHRLIDALVEAVGRENIETGSRVTSLGMAEGTIESLTTATDGGTETHSIDEVIVAAMPNVLESLTGYTCDIDFQATVCSVLSLSESLMDTYWLNIADDAPFGALIEHTNFIPTERYGGEHLLYAVSYVQDPSEDIWQMTDDEVEATWLAGIEDLFPDFNRSLVNWIRTARNPRTAPVYERGYLDMVIPYDLAETVADDTYYAGMASRAQYPERSLNGAIEAGFACAQQIIGTHTGQQNGITTSISTDDRRDATRSL
jgi:protoporphyrinogen oxidase